MPGGPVAAVPERLKGDLKVEGRQRGFRLLFPKTLPSTFRDTRCRSGASGGLEHDALSCQVRLTAFLEHGGSGGVAQPQRSVEAFSHGGDGPADMHADRPPPGGPLAAAQDGSRAGDRYGHNGYLGFARHDESTQME